MNYTLRFIQFFTLGVWLGSIIYLIAITPGLFRVIPNQDQTGLVVEFAITRLHTLGVVAGLLFMFASVILATAWRAPAKRIVLPAAGVTLMILLTLVSQHFVIAPMADLRREMVSVATTPSTNPLRARFDRLHGASVDLEAAVLLIGFVSLFLTARAES